MTVHWMALMTTVETLRGPNGCPWDREQTLATLSPYVIEEGYELADAMVEGDPNHLKEELGDVLFQVMLIAQLASEEGWFVLDDVAQTANDKMIRRHPHVFGETKLSTSDDVIAQWASIKAREKIGQQQHPVQAIPRQLPALQQQAKLQIMAQSMGLPTPAGDIPSIQAWVDQLQAGPNEAVVGGLLREVVAFCIHHHMQPESIVSIMNQHDRGVILAHSSDPSEGVV